MGATNIQRYLGEYGGAACCKGAFALSSPWDIESYVSYLGTSYFGSKVYIDGIQHILKSHLQDRTFHLLIKEKGIDLGKHDC